MNSAIAVKLITGVNPIHSSILTYQSSKLNHVWRYVGTSPSGTPGAGAGRGGGAGGSVRESGGALGKYGAAQEESFFYNKEREQLEKIKNKLKQEPRKPPATQKHGDPKKQHKDMVKFYTAICPKFPQAKSFEKPYSGCLTIVKGQFVPSVTQTRLFAEKDPKDTPKAPAKTERAEEMKMPGFANPENLNEEGYFSQIAKKQLDKLKSKLNKPDSTEKK